MAREPIAPAQLRSTEALPKPASGTELPRVRVKVDWLRLRDGPSTSGTRVLAELPRDTELVILEQRDGWIRVARPTGWVNADYVSDKGQG